MTDEASPLPTQLRHRGGVQQAALSVVKENEKSEEIREQELRSYVNLYGGATSDASHHEIPLMDVVGCARIFRQATVLSVCLWLLLVASVYVITPFDKWEYLQGMEREAAVVAVYVIALSLFFVLIQPLGLQKIRAASHSSRRCSNKWSGILVSVVAVQCTAIVAAIFCYRNTTHDIRQSSS
jgi:hypothetical protein